MTKFKGAEGKWGCVFTSDKSRAVRNKGGLIAKMYKPSKYNGQDERYDSELEEVRCNQRLIASAPELLDALQDLIRFCEDNNVGAELEYANDVVKNAIG